MDQVTRSPEAEMVLAVHRNRDIGAVYVYNRTTKSGACTSVLEQGLTTIKDECACVVRLALEAERILPDNGTISVLVHGTSFVAQVWNEFVVVVPVDVGGTAKKSLTRFLRRLRKRHEKAAAATPQGAHV